MATIYEDGTYLTLNPDWHMGHSEWKARHISDIIAKNAIRPNTIVDVGCGGGQILTSLAKSFGKAECIGYDISPQAIEIAERMKDVSNVSFRCGTYRCEMDKFDLLLAVDVMEHVEDYIGFTSYLAQTCEFAVFHIPLEINVLHTVFDRHPKRRIEVGHLHYFSFSTAMDTLRHCGFEIIDWKYTLEGLELPEARSRWDKKVLRLPRRLSFAASPHLSVRLFGGCALLVLGRSTYVREAIGTSDLCSGPASARTRLPAS